MRYWFALLLSLVSAGSLTSIGSLISVAAPVLKGGISESVALKPGWSPGWQVTVQQANGKPATQVPVALPQVGWHGTTNHSGRVTIPAIPQATAVIRIQSAEKLGEPLWETLPPLTNPPGSVVFQLKASQNTDNSRINDAWHHLGDGRYEAWSLGAKAFQTQQAEGPLFKAPFTCPRPNNKAACTLTLGMVQGLDTEEAHQQASVTQKSTASPLILSVNNRWRVAIVRNGAHQRWNIPANALNPSAGQQMLTLTAGSHLNVLGQLDYDDCEFGGLWVTAQ